MTTPHDAVPIEVEDVVAAINTIRSAGLRLSAARRLVLHKVYAAGRPVTAEELAAGVDGSLPPSDLASVYRTLDTLERLGLVTHMHVGHGPGLYALAHREHAVCQRCEAVVPLEPGQAEAIRRAIAATCDLDVRFSHSPLVGVCGRCRATPSCEPLAPANAPRSSFTHPPGGPSTHTPASGNSVEGAP